jgi:adenylate cyclase
MLKNQGMYEIERKYLVDKQKWKPTGNGVKITQGYLVAESKKTVRVRIKGRQAYLTVKGEPNGIKRTELEYEIPVIEAEIMLEMADGFLIEKKRYLEKRGDFIWEVDVFEGENNGLVLAEVELENESLQPEWPDWILEEVSGNEKYFNYNLSKKPFLHWTENKG